MSELNTNKVDHQESPDLQNTMNLKHPLNAVVFGLFWCLVFVVFLQFVTRYVLNSSFAWTEEIARYLLIITVFLGGALAARQRAHIAVEVLQQWMPATLRRVLIIVTYLISVCFFSICAFLTAELAITTRQHLVTVDISKAVMYWIVAIGFAAMAFYTLQQALKKANPPVN